MRLHAQLIGVPGTYDLKSVSTKTRKSSHLLVFLQRQHFLLNDFKVFMK